MRSYDLDGKLLWSLKGMSSITIATPYADHGLLYVSSGYVLDKQKPIYAIRPGATGDISLDRRGDLERVHRLVATASRPVQPLDDCLGRPAVSSCTTAGCFAGYDAKTARNCSSPQRLPNGRAFTSSPWAYGGKIFCLNEDGVTFVLKDGGQFELLHTNSLAEDDMCMATPAIVGDRLLIRTSARVYCIQSPKTGP